MKNKNLKIAQATCRKERIISALKPVTRIMTNRNVKRQSGKLSTSKILKMND